MESRTLRLLIVDDEATIREVLRDELLAHGRKDILLEEAESGSEALDKLRNEDFDLVLLDLRLPLGTEGFDALKEIKKIKPQTDVIMISAWGDIARAVEALKLGAIDFIPKGPQFEQIIRIKVNDFIRTTNLIADRELLIQARYDEAMQATNTHQKGKALEELVAALFASIPGFIEIGRDINTATEEIDIVYRNESLDPAWQKESDLMLVECKNWKSQRVGKNEFVLFKEKMENRTGRCKLGFLICTEDFAETIEKEMLRSSKTDLLVVPINGDKLKQLVEAKDRSLLLRDCVDQALLV